MTAVADLDRERRARALEYVLLRLRELVAVGRREAWWELVEHAQRELERLEKERDARPVMEGER